MPWPTASVSAATGPCDEGQRELLHRLHDQAQGAERGDLVGGRHRGEGGDPAGRGDVGGHQPVESGRRGGRGPVPGRSRW